MSEYTPIGREFRVSSEATQVEGLTTMTGLDDGRYVVVWWEQDFGAPARHEIAQIYSANGTPLKQVALPVSPAVLGISSLVGGGFVVTYQVATGDGNQPNIGAQIYDSTGVAVGETILIDPHFFRGGTTVAGLANGGFVISWADITETEGLLAQVFSPTGGRVGNTFVVSTSSTGENYPTVTGLADGNFVASWTHSDTANGNHFYAVEARLFTSGGAAIGNVFDVATATQGAVFLSRVTSLSNGGFVVTWRDNTGQHGDPDEGIMARVYGPGGAPLGNGFLVNHTTSGLQLYPEITSLADGGFVITWTDLSADDGSTNSNDIKAQIFDVSGSKVGDELTVNSTIEGNQWFSHVASLKDGGFVVAWTDSTYWEPAVVTNGVMARIYGADAWPKITVTTASPGVLAGQANVVALEEGGPAGSVHFELSRAASFPITVSVSLSPGDWAGDVSLTTLITIPAGATSFTTNVATALSDNKFDPIHSGQLLFTATGGIDPNTGSPRSLDFTQNDVPIQVVDQALSEAGHEDLQKGLEWGKDLIEYWKNATNAALTLNGIDIEHPKAAAGVYGKALEHVATLAGVIYDGTLVKFQLESRLQHARSVALLDKQAGAHEAFVAYETANVDFISGLVKSVLVGSGTAFSVGVIMGIAAIPTATIAAPVLLGIGVGWLANYTYEQLGFDATVKDSIKTYWDQANPKLDFENNWIQSLPATSPVVTPNLLQLTSTEHDGVLTGNLNVGATGNDLNNILLGNVGDNTLYALGGDDAVFGEGGNDRLVAGSGAGDDYYDGGSGTDVIIFASATLPVVIDLRAGTANGAETGQDTLANIEDVVAGAGNDIITGDDYANTLTGGAGQDAFIDTKAGHDGDRITDYARGDRIVISDATMAGFTYHLSGNLLSFTGGSVTLDNLHLPSIAASVAPEGGVQITFSGPPLILAGGGNVMLANGTGVLAQRSDGEKLGTPIVQVDHFLEAAQTLLPIEPQWNDSHMAYDPLLFS